MKDIKFRGKRFGNGELVIGDLTENQGRSFIYHATSESTTEDNADGRIVIAAAEAGPATAEQYTGPKNKTGTEITSDGWKTGVTADGKTYTEHHGMSDEGCFAKCAEGNLETAGIPGPIVYALDGFFCFGCVRALRECG